MTLGGASVALGDRIAGRYRIESWLGQGHMAVVYQARHEGTGKTCALKLVHAHLAVRGDIVDLFVREAQVGGRIGHSPYIVDVFDAGVDEQRGLPFLAMELLQGETLEQYLKERGPMSPGMVREIFGQLAEALDQAHDAGVVHRDLKPSNLFLTHDKRGRPVIKIVDFGIAKVLEREAQRTATQVGSPAYAAPEQLGQTLRKLAEKQGIEIASRVSAATDVWALGLLAYELFTGLVAGQFWNQFDTLSDLIVRVVLEDPEPASVRAGDRAHLLPVGFDGWLARCLRKNADERWPSAGAAAKELGRLMDSVFDNQPTMRQTSREALLGMRGIEGPPQHDTVRINPEPFQAPSARLGADQSFVTQQWVPEPAHTEPRREPSSPQLPSREPSYPQLPSREPSYPHLSRPEPSRPELLGNDALHLRSAHPEHPLASSSPGLLPPDAGVAGTKVISRQPSRTFPTAVVLAALATLIAIGLLTLAFLPRNGGLKISVQTESGAPVDRAEIFVDGMKRCDVSPCVVTGLRPGSKSIKVITLDARLAGPIEELVEAGEEKAIVLTVAAPILKGPPGANGGNVDPGSKLIVPPEPPPTPTSVPIDSPPTPVPPPVTSSSAPIRVDPCALNLNSIPVSKVLIDGRPLGTTPKVRVPVSPGDHTVTFIYPPYPPKSVKATLRSGETKTVSVKFP